MRIEDDTTRQRVKVSASFYVQPMLSFMLLILEDRAVMEVERIILDRIPKTAWKNDPKVAEMCELILHSHKRPQKRGVIGKYIYNRNKFALTQDEQLALCEVCESYDDAISLPVRVLRKKVAEFVAEKTDIDKRDHELMADLLIAIIACSYVDSYYSGFYEHLGWIEMYMRDMKMEPKPFHDAANLLDNIAFYIAKKPIDFTEKDGWLKCYDTYINTVNSEERLLKHYNALGINQHFKKSLEKQ